MTKFSYIMFCDDVLVIIVAWERLIFVILIHYWTLAGLSFIGSADAQVEFNGGVETIEIMLKTRLLNLFTKEKNVDVIT